MKKLLTYLNSLNKEDRLLFCVACGISEGYMRKAISAGQGLNPSTCVAIEQATKGEVTCEELRPDVDWEYLSRRQPLRAEVA